VAGTSEYFSIGGADPDSFIQSDNEVLVVALDGGDNVYLAVEPAPAFGGQSVLILPGGIWEQGEDPKDTANRELQEEIGQRAAQIEPLVELWPWAKYLTVRSLVYLARDLSAHKLQGDEHYEVGMERVPLSSFETLIESGRLRDARTIAALHLARARLAHERAPK
jgi:8-oxo-dGTP pyrophosphatase MutT (NUDIX family)